MQPCNTQRSVSPTASPSGGHRVSTHIIRRAQSTTKWGPKRCRCCPWGVSPNGIEWCPCRRARHACTTVCMLTAKSSFASAAWSAACLDRATRSHVRLNVPTRIFKWVRKLAFSFALCHEVVLAFLYLLVKLVHSRSHMHKKVMHVRDDKRKCLGDRHVVSYSKTVHYVCRQSLLQLANHCPIVFQCLLKPLNCLFQIWGRQNYRRCQQLLDLRGDYLPLVHLRCISP
mmetsp:Transcript_44496/g.133062  ORF Transcript_44496/g.133062 Transcript_44496/m.133062 type:complete len:228 (-) Transcript_44496:969-1652(-)